MKDASAAHSRTDAPAADLATDAPEAQAPLRVGLLFHSANSGNMGIGALTFADMALTREAAGGRPVVFTMLGFDDRTPAYPALAGTPSVPIRARTILDPRAFAAAARRLDLVIDIGAGDSFADIYGRKRLGFLIAAKAIVMATGTPLVLAPQTIGPFASRFWGWIAERIVASAAASFARDALSIEALKSPKARARVRLASDVAFALPFTRPERPAGGPTRVGINVSGLLYHGGYTGRNEFGLAFDYAAFSARLIERLLAEPGVEIALTPHVITEPGVREDDHAACALLAERYGLAPPPRFRDPVEAKSAISGMDFFVGARMHSCIAAVSSGVACAPIAYSRKFEGLFGALGYHETVDARALDADAALAAVMSTFERREAAARAAAAAAEAARARLSDYVADLSRLLAQAADRRAA